LGALSTSKIQTTNYCKLVSQQKRCLTGFGQSHHRPRLRDFNVKEEGSLSRNQGILGERDYQLGDSDAQEIEKPDRFQLFPNLETHQETFNGIPFQEIPICLIRCSKNNTKIGIRHADGRDVCYTSASMEGFKNAKKKSLVAGQATGVAGASRALRRGVDTVRVQIKGMGPGRMTAIKGLTLGGLNIVCVQDITPLPEMGPRPKKARRL
jgi:small subunit ribosomal protein S11